MKKFLFLLIILCFTVNAYAAKIKLKTGMVVTCDIIAKTDKYVEVDFRGTNVKFYFDEIDQIIEDAVSPEKAASTEETGAVGQKKDGFFGIAALGQNFLQSQKKKMQSSRTCSLRPVSDRESIIPLIFSVFFLTLVIVSMWKVYHKAGYPGWAILVPIYNLYVSVKIAGYSGWLLLLFFVPFVNIVVNIIISVGLAKRFDRGAGFGLGLAFLPFIFYPILAFSSASYSAVDNI